LKRGLIAFLFAGIAAAKGGAVSDVSSFALYQGGNKQELPPLRSDVASLIERCEGQLRTADNILRLAPTPELVQGLRAHEVVLEIVYRRPQSFAIGFNKQTIEVGRLLIPLTGEFAGGGPTTIFHGGSTYAAGPYRNSQGPASLAELARGLGARIP